MTGGSPRWPQPGKRRGPCWDSRPDQGPSSLPGAGRRTCRDCGRTWHPSSPAPAHPDICDRCGGEQKKIAWSGACAPGQPVRGCLAASVSVGHLG
ncbi:hypothetical protein ABT214_24530 [Micromonospora purpureochromogenes]|uniref:hypothetical protein n=1 Tax=Micromonospora purpureochromogenes TaxID=47872 RepID=UPI00331F3959